MMGQDRMLYARSTAGGAARAILIVLVVLVVAVGVAGFELFREATEVKVQATNIMADMDTMKGQLSRGEVAGASTTARRIADTADQMHATTEGPLWQVASALPFVGADVGNVRALTTVLDDLSSEVLLPIAEVVNESGSLNLTAALSLSDQLDDMDAAIQRSARTLNRLPKGSIPEVNNAVSRAREAIGQVTEITSTIATLAGYASALSS